MRRPMLIRSSATGGRTAPTRQGEVLRSDRGTPLRGRIARNRPQTGAGLPETSENRYNSPQVWDSSGECRIRCLESVLRVLEPAGVFLATTPNVTHPYSRLKLLANGTFFWFSPELYWDSGHTTPLPEWLLRAHVAHAGFQDIEHGFIGNFDNYPVAKRILIKAMSRRLHCAGAPLGVEGDGGNLVILARKASR